MNDYRPKNLNLFTIHFPIPAIISILHRISGVLLYLATPFVLWLLSKSLSSEYDFNAAKELLAMPLGKLIIWCMLAPFLFHFIAGIRHLLLDMNIGVSLRGGRFSAFVVALVSAVLIIMAGFYIW